MIAVKVGPCAFDEETFFQGARCTLTCDDVLNALQCPSVMITMIASIRHVGGGMCAGTLSLTVGCGGSAAHGCWAAPSRGRFDGSKYRRSIIIFCDTTSALQLLSTVASVVCGEDEFVKRCVGEEPPPVTVQRLPFAPHPETTF